MTTSFSTVSLVAALNAFQGKLGSLEWVACNAEQERLIDQYMPPDFSVFSKAELEALASYSADELNAALATRGSSLRFDPFNEDEMGAYGSLIVNVNWLEKGQKCTVSTKPGFSFAQLSDETATVRWAELTGQPVACARTREEDMVYMTPYSRALSGLELVTTAKAIQESLCSIHKENKAALNDQVKRSFALMNEGCNFNEAYTLGGVVFPMVDLEQELNLDWLKELRCLPQSSNPYKVVEAVQANKLKMNHIGAAVRSDTSVKMVLECYTPPTTPLVIDEPFLTWFVRPGLEEPFFVAMAEQDCWKEPKDLKVKFSSYSHRSEKWGFA